CSCSESKCCALELNFPLIAITPRSLQKVGRFVRLPTQIDPVPNGQQLSELDPFRVGSPRANSPLPNPNGWHLKFVASQPCTINYLNNSIVGIKTGQRSGLAPLNCAFQHGDGNRF